MIPVLHVQKFLTGPAFRYLMVGCLIYSVDILLFSGILSILGDKQYFIANAIAKTLAAIFGFFLHKKFTFSGDHQLGARRQFMMYIGLFLFNIVLSSALIFLLVGFMLLPPLQSRIATDVVVTITAFISSQKIIFRLRN